MSASRREKLKALITLQSVVEDKENNTEYHNGYGNRNKFTFQ